MVSLDESRMGDAADPLASAAEDAGRIARLPPQSRSATLARMIEADIIPRLLIANGRPPPQPRATAALEADRQDIEAFARMMIGLDLVRANVVVAGAMSRGVAVESVLLDLFAPTAKRLGEMWVEDACSFTDVTVGLCALQSLLRTFTSGDVVEPTVMHDGRVLIAAAPEEQHTFGVLMLETFFRRAGWDVIGMPMSSAGDVLGAVSRRSFSIVGFSLSRDCALDGLRDLIAATRKASVNAELAVMVGGRVFNDAPAKVRFVGADLTAQDADQALIASQHLICSRVQTH
jgi:MerR family transcriptional regulator, light-induced transcriptional regulator